MSDLPAVDRTDALPAVGYADRADRVRRRFDEQALLVTNLTNVRWLTGFTGSNGWVAVLPDRLVLGHRRSLRRSRRGRARRRRRRRRDPHRLHARPSTRSAGRHAARSRGGRCRGVGAHPCGVDGTGGRDRHRAERRSRRGRAPRQGRRGDRPHRPRRRASPTPRSPPSHRCSATGRPRSTSATSSSTGCAASVPTGRATTRSWHPVPTTPPARTTQPGDARDRRRRHRRDRRRRPRRRLPLRHDAHATSSATRPPEQQEIYDLVLETQLAGLAAVRAGVAARDVDAACRDVFDAEAVSTWYLHGTGHGVGLLIHEDPFHTPDIDPGIAGRGRGDGRARALSFWVRRFPGRGPGRGHRTGCRILTAIAQGHPMPAITTNDLKNGITLELDNGLFQVVEFQHVKPGKGGAFVRTKLRNVKTGNVFDRTFNAGVRVEQAIVEPHRDAVPVPRRRRLRVHGQPELRADHRDVGGPRRRRRLPGRGHDRPARLPQRRDHQRRDPGVGRAHDRRDRAGRAGRPRVRRPQAGARSRPARSSRCRCSSRPATRSGSTRAPAST